MDEEITHVLTVVQHTLCGAVHIQERENEETVRATTVVVNFLEIIEIEGTNNMPYSIWNGLCALAIVERFSWYLRRFPLWKKIFWRKFLMSEVMFDADVPRIEDWVLEDADFPGWMLLNFDEIPFTKELYDIFERFFVSEISFISDYTLISGVATEICKKEWMQAKRWKRQAIGISFTNAHFNADSLELLQMFLNTYASDHVDVRSQSWGYGLAITMLNLSDNVFDAAEMTIVAEILKNNHTLTLEEVYLENIITGETDDDALLAPFRSLINVAFHVPDEWISPSKSTHCQSKLRHLSLARNQLTGQYFAVISSALRGASAVESLSLASTLPSFDADEREQCWRYLAFGLSKQHTSVLDRVGVQPKLRRLDLSRNPLFPSDVEVWIRSMRSPALELLSLDSPGSIDERHPVHRTGWLKQNAQIYASPDILSSCLCTVSQQECEVEILHIRDDAWMCVVVPGVGNVWVETQNVLNIHCEQRNEASTISNGVIFSELVMNNLVGNQTRMQALTAFIASIGCQMTSLALRHNPMNSTNLAAIISSCVKLQHLDLSGCRLYNVAPLMVALRGELGSRLLSLNLNGNVIATHVFDDLAHILAATTRIPALRELHLCQSGIGANGIGWLRLALEVNKTLTMIELDSIPSPALGTREKVYATLAARLEKAYQNEFLGTLLLTMSQKMAFLSIVTKIKCVQALDPIVVSLIFDYAAGTRWRRLQWKPIMPTEVRLS